MTDYLVKGVSQRGCHRTGIDIEERPGDDTQGQVLHRLGHIDFASRLPLVERLLRHLHHDICIALHSMLMKRGLHQAALLAVKISVAGEQTITEEQA